MKSAFEAARKYNKDIAGGAATDAVVEIDEQLSALFMPGPEKRNLGEIRSRILLMSLAKAGGAKISGDYIDTRLMEQKEAVIRLYSIARREVVKDKIESGEAPEDLRGQFFEAEIDQKLTSLQSLLTKGWRESGGPGYVKENVSEDMQGLLRELMSVHRHFVGVSAFLFRHDPEDGSHKAMSENRITGEHLSPPAEDGKLYLYRDDYERLMQYEAEQSRNKREKG